MNVTDPKAPMPVHPRIRGERCAARWPHLSGCGSSPHTRGTLSASNGDKFRARFIPAYAGNATDGAQLQDVHSVHPRIRGERADALLSLNSGTGSSPHTRGTPLQGRAG